MALSTEFCLPNSSFDPTKYSRKPSARSKIAVKPPSQPNSKTPTTTTASAQKLGVARPPNNGPGSANIDSQYTPSAIKDKASPDVESEQPTSFSSSEWEMIDDAMSKKRKITPISGCQTEQHTCFPSLKMVSSKPDPEEDRSCPVTLLAPENLKLASIPPPGDTESTDTRRLVSIRRIRSIRQAKVENRWLTLAQVDEWTCTVPRHAFEEGELVVYIEIDAFLPCSDERFGKMTTLQTFDGVLGHRVKTKRFGSHPNKLLVQGHIYKIDKFAEIYQEIKCILNVVADNPFYNASHDMIKTIICAMYRNRDWAATIGVKKWDESKQVNKPDRHQKLGGVPTRVFKKTDITHFEVRDSWSDSASSGSAKTNSSITGLSQLVHQGKVFRQRVPAVHQNGWRFDECILREEDRQEVSRLE